MEPGENANWRLLGYLKPYWKQTLAGYFSMTAATILALIIPRIIAEAIDIGLETGEVTALYLAAAIILGIGIVRAVFGYGQIELD